MSATEILEQIRRLPENERREVARQILEEFGDIDDGLSPEQIDELERRADRVCRNPESGIPWEQPEQAAELDRRAEDALNNPGRGTPIEEVSAEIKKRFGWK